MTIFSLDYWKYYYAFVASIIQHAAPYELSTADIGRFSFPVLVPKRGLRSR